jgi:hypothetical protein|tara:strand:- start:541 stop:1083 length:543 start_codon:yes stop_codon:yes gene_type:complete
MKRFEQYLAESEKEYAFRLRCACDLTEDHMDKIENRLKKYEAFSVSAPKKTMFQSAPPGFNHLSGAEVNIVDFKTRMPVAPHVLLQDIIECSKLPESHVRVSNVNEPLEEEFETPEEPTGAILEQPYEEVDNSHLYGPKLIGNLLGDLAKEARKLEFAKPIENMPESVATEDGTKSPVGS